MVLKPLKHERPNPNRIVRFMDELKFRGFNQSTYYPLRMMPSGVFINAKADQKSDEARVQLGLWLASWFGRVSEFPYLGERNDVLPPPVIPILIVESMSWQLWFAFDTPSQYEVCGPVKIGDTYELESAYRLLAVLRISAHWMATGFLEWVDDCLKQAVV
ncbi:hypothetical protein F4782DRAFT_217684 [Xylaria castorea]|nr:hypothetical protein F4782DRAFT_217684 [Xylaria castorea]